MEDIAVLVDGLLSKDNNAAYACLQQLQKECEISDAVYPYFDLFAEMLFSGNSYVRTRGMLLIAANAKWDTDYKIDEIIDEYLKHIEDEKPITSRQCIKALPEIAKCKPELASDILRALKNANTGKYKSSMQPLIQKDIADALMLINE
ncbi:MAG: SufBD protein [Lachnospiraceae bacterium]|nr:SufBD protein [Lachnospiraceae bacterium]